MKTKLIVLVSLLVVLSGVAVLVGWGDFAKPPKSQEFSLKPQEARAYVAGSASNGGTLSGVTLTWNIGAVASGASGSVSFRVKAD